MRLEIPHKTYDELRKVANQFFDRYHISREAPVPIEDIIELDLKINIVPLPGLRELFIREGIQIKGYLSSDLKDLTIDENIQQNSPKVYRSILAHELAHYILHKDLYFPRQFSNSDEWKHFYKNLPASVISVYEWQAKSLAGLLVVPEMRLSQVVRKSVRALVKVAAKSGIEGPDYIKPMWDYIYEAVSDELQVPLGTVQRRIELDEIHKSINEEFFPARSPEIPLESRIKE